jgi:L-ascorbate metabolism protein UlaG (beta-lactamase superfamily)
LGHSCFKIKGKQAVLVTDPYDKSIGLRLPKTQADIVTVSHAHPDHNNVQAIGGNPQIVDGPGEYEIKKVVIYGIPSFHDEKQGQDRGTNTIYLIEADGLRLCHLGDLGHNLTDSELEEIDGVDVLMIPVGEVYTIGVELASKIINEVEPHIVIPMHYRTDKTTLKKELHSIDKFCKEMGISKKEEDKLVIHAGKVPEEMKVVILKSKG